MTTKTVFEITHHSDPRPNVRIIDRLPVRIGRAFDNDIVLTDPYVSAYHAVVEYDVATDTLVIKDLNSENGIATKNGKSVLGQTEIKFFDSATPVPPALKINTQNAWLAHSSIVWISWLSFFLAVSATIGWTYLEVWNEKISETLTVTGMASAAIILLWAAAWSLVGRVTRHRGFYSVHLLLGSIYIFVALVLGAIQSYIDFASNENMASVIIDRIFIAATMGPLMYAALSFATAIHKKQRLIASTLFVVAIIGSAALFSAVTANDFDDRPHYPPQLEPYFTSLLPAKTVDAFMSENKHLFDKKIFKDIK